jgi:hypothetical protein
MKNSVNANRVVADKQKGHCIRLGAVAFLFLLKIYKRNVQR